MARRLKLAMKMGSTYRLHEIGSHHIRTRGSNDFVFLDLHIWMEPAMPLEHAHALSHEVKDRLMTAFPQIKDAVIHIEPPPKQSAV